MTADRSIQVRYAGSVYELTTSDLAGLLQTRARYASLKQKHEQLEGFAAQVERERNLLAKLLEQAEAEAQRARDDLRELTNRTIERLDAVLDGGADNAED